MTTNPEGYVFQCFRGRFSILSCRIQVTTCYWRQADTKKRPQE